MIQIQTIVLWQCFTLSNNTRNPMGWERVFDSMWTDLWKSRTLATSTCTTTTAFLPSDFNLNSTRYFIARNNVSEQIKNTKHWPPSYCLDMWKYCMHWQEWVALLLCLLCLTHVRQSEFSARDNEVLNKTKITLKNHKQTKTKNINTIPSKIHQYHSIKQNL